MRTSSFRYNNLDTLPLRICLQKMSAVYFEDFDLDIFKVIFVRILNCEIIFTTLRLYEFMNL